MVGAGAVGSAAAPVYPSLHIVRLMELTAQIANKPDLQPLSNSGLPQHSLTETREFLHALKAIPHKLHNGKFTPWRKDTHAHLHVHVTRQLSDLLLLWLSVQLSYLCETVSRNYDCQAYTHALPLTAGEPKVKCFYVGNFLLGAWRRQPGHGERVDGRWHSPHSPQLV